MFWISLSNHSSEGRRAWWGDDRCVLCQCWRNDHWVTHPTSVHHRGQKWMARYGKRVHGSEPETFRRVIHLQYFVYVPFPQPHLRWCYIVLNVTATQLNQCHIGDAQLIQGSKRLRRVLNFFLKLKMLHYLWPCNRFWGGGLKNRSSPRFN